MYLVMIKFYEARTSIFPRLVSYSVEAAHERAAEIVAYGLFLSHYPESDECATLDVKEF